MGTNLKLSCSLKWLFRILSENYSLEDLEERKLLQKGAIQNLLLEPYSKGRLKQQTVDLLSDASLYWSTYLAIYPGGRAAEENFECLIHNLAKNGGYVLENDDVIVNGSMLAQKTPFRETSHLALLDVLMVQYASKIVTVRRTVQAARRILSFNPSQELPSKPDVEQLLMLWLNKVSQAVEGEHYARRRRRNKRVKGIPTITGDLCTALKDGRNLALLLLYYAPESFSWHDFNLDDNYQSEQYLSNIQTVYEYCNIRFAPYTFHVSPVDFWQWTESGLLRCNILACLAHLFHSLEVQPSTSTMRVPPISRHIGTHHTNVLQSASDSVITKKKRKEWPDSSGNRASRRRLDHSMSSKLTDSNALKSTLPEVKLSLVQQDQTANGTISSNFIAPIRSSRNLAQTSILSKFKKEKGLSAPLAHSQSFPLTGRQPQFSSTQQTPSSSTIRLSPINMDIVKTSLGDKSNLTDDGSKGKDAHTGKQDSLRLDNVRSKDNSEELENVTLSSSGSFTVHKRHTFSSAAAAGLPVVDGKFSCSSDKTTIFQEPTDDNCEADDCKNTILLTNFLEFHHNPSLERVESEVELAVPPSVQKLKDKLIPVLASFHSADAKLEAHVTAVVSRVCPNWKSKITSGVLKSLKLMSVSDAVGSADVEEVAAENHSVNDGVGRVTAENCASNDAKRIATESCGSKGTKGTAMENNVKEIAVENCSSGGVKGIVAENCGLNGACSNAMRQGESHVVSLEQPDVVTSLEQFERDELLARQQATPSLSEQSEIKPAVVSDTQYCSYFANGTEHSPNSLPDIRQDNGCGVTCNGSACGVDSNSEVGISRITSNVDGTGNKATQCAEETVTTGNFARKNRQESLILHGENGKSEMRREGKILPPRNTCDITNDASRHGAAIGSMEDNLAIIIGGGNSMSSIDQFEGELLRTDARSIDGGSVGDSVAGECGGGGCNSDRVWSSYSVGSCRDNMRMATFISVSNDAGARPSNPWVSPLHLDVVTTPLQKQKEKKLKHLLDERDRARKSAAEKRKKVHNSTTSILTSMAPSEDVHQDARPVVADSTHMVDKRSASYLEYSGPNCYTKPKAKTNVPIVRNAISTVCLAGEVNNPIKESVIKVLEQTTATHVLVLFRDRVGFKFRGVYSYYPGERFISRIFGTGPKEIKDIMISALYKYNSGQKDFKEIPSRSFSVSVDGLTINSECWYNAKRKSSAKSNQLF